MVQERVRSNGGAGNNTNNPRGSLDPVVTPGSANSLNPDSNRPKNAIELPLRMPPPSATNPDPTAANSDLAEYVNVNCSNGVAPHLESSDGYLIPNTPMGLPSANVINNREYQNITTPTAKSPGHLTSQKKDSIIPGAQVRQSPSRQDQPVFFRDDVIFQQQHSSVGKKTSVSSNDALQAENNDNGDCEINYIAVDFESPVPTSPSAISQSGIQVVAPSSSNFNGTVVNNTSTSSPQYSTIDIGRTLALSTTAKQQNQRALDGISDSPVGSRKTRHNSTLSEIASGVAAVVKRNSVID